MIDIFFTDVGEEFGGYFLELKMMFALVAMTVAMVKASTEFHCLSFSHLGDSFATFTIPVTCNASLVSVCQQGWLHFLWKVVIIATMFSYFAITCAR